MPKFWLNFGKSSILPGDTDTSGRLHNCPSFGRRIDIERQIKKMQRLRAEGYPGWDKQISDLQAILKCNGDLSRVENTGSINSGGFSQTSSTPKPVPNVVKIYNPTDNPISVGLAAIKIMNDNPNRYGFRITNAGLTDIIIGLGRVPTQTSWDHVLSPISAAGKKDGGVLVDDGVYLEAVYVLSDAVGGLIALVERP